MMFRVKINGNGLFDYYDYKGIYCTVKEQRSHGAEYFVDIMTNIGINLFSTWLFDTLTSNNGIKSTSINDRNFSKQAMKSKDDLMSFLKGLEESDIVQM